MTIVSARLLFPLPAIVWAAGVLSCSQTPAVPAPAQPADWYHAEQSMTAFYHIADMPQHRRYMLAHDDSAKFAEHRKQVWKELDAAADVMQRMSAQEKTALALVYLREYDASLKRHPLPPSGAKSHLLWDDISNWDGMWSRSVATLPPEHRAVLDTGGGNRLMHCYGAYLLVRYIAYDEQQPRAVRRKAERIAMLWREYADGAEGYRCSMLPPDMRGY